jgi:putative FmdB family regulatory protein
MSAGFGQYNGAVPVYEYEPKNHDCLMCEGKFEVIQGVQDEPLALCPWCGLDVRRVISKAAIKIAGTAPDDKSARKGFTTFRKAEKGVWEKVGGEGPDVLVGTKEDLAAVDAEKAPSKKVIDLDQTPD